MLKSMAGYDVKDSTSIDLSVPDYETNINKNIKGKRIGIP
jgi:aspartyl-tRNA(Asn)/glutamyl-tRNA(Gln) amidotransferase subunit A